MPRVFWGERVQVSSLCLAEKIKNWPKPTSETWTEPCKSYGISDVSKLTSPNYWIHGRNIWHWDCVFRHGCIQRHKIQGKILDAKTHFKQTETLYIHLTSFHPLNVKKGFVKGEALRILRKNSSETTFEENNSNLKERLGDGGYPQSLIENLLSEIKFTKRSLNS